MGLSINEFVYAGVDTFTLNFAMGYMSRADVTAYKQGAPLVDLTFDWVTSNTVRLAPGQGLVNGDVVVFRRTVSKTALPVDLTVEQNATREALQLSFEYVMHNVHELLDERAATSFDWEYVGGAGEVYEMLYLDYMTIYTESRDAV